MQIWLTLTAIWTLGYSESLNFANYKAYCKLCKGGNSLCKYGPDCKPSSCDKESAGMTERVRKAMLQEHNEQRNKVAMGKAGHGLPAASNMRYLNYDLELEALAACWALHQCHMGHDDCRQTLDGEKIGQNVFWSSMSNPYNEKNLVMEAKEAVQNWYSEIDLVQQENLFPYGGSRDIGHFTQNVWATTAFLGCGIAYETAGVHAIFIVCNYKPAGNAIENVYTKGNWCTSCPGNATCNAKLTGLCGADVSHNILRSGWAGDGGWTLLGTAVIGLTGWWHMS